MRPGKANITGLTSSLQQTEMKSILTGTWPPLRPLPVFKYETVECRATIEFDKRRGEWVCRKTSLPSNNVQELRGGLREITMVLPHGELVVLAEGPEQGEQEIEKDTNRRRNALHEWKENYENGALYFELRDCLSESQQTEIDDSLRLSLTARQLQFNPKNAAEVFDTLSTAGGRFAALIELAKRNKEKRGTAPPAPVDGTVSKSETETDPDKPPLAGKSSELGYALNKPFGWDQKTAEHATDADEIPSVSIKNVLQEQDQVSLAERIGQTASQQFGNETSESADTDSLLSEHFQEEGHDSAVPADLETQVRTGMLFADRIDGQSLPSRLPALEISAFQVAVVASLFLSAVIAFTIGLTVGRGPLGQRIQEVSKSILAFGAKSPPLPEQQGKSNTRTLSPQVASLGANVLGDSTPSEGKSNDNTGGIRYSTEAHSSDSEPPTATESNPAAKPEGNSEHSGATTSLVINPSPPASSTRANSPISAGTPNAAGLTAPTTPVPRLSRPAAIIVPVPGRSSKPLRVIFAEKAIAATSSFAMTSQLSVLLSPEARPTMTQRPARLEAGELVSFAWPHYPRLKDQSGLAEVIQVRVSIGQFGQVREVKFLSGSISLLAPTVRAVRQWRYTPTLLNKKPIQAEQDVTIEFRPSQHSSQISTQRRSKN